MLSRRLKIWAFGITGRLCTAVEIMDIIDIYDIVSMGAPANHSIPPFVRRSTWLLYLIPIRRETCFTILSIAAFDAKIMV